MGILILRLFILVERLVSRISVGKENLTLTSKQCVTKDKSIIEKKKKKKK
jgi:hypothetical protein